MNVYEVFVQYRAFRAWHRVGAPERFHVVAEGIGDIERVLGTLSHEFESYEIVQVLQISEASRVAVDGVTE